MTDALQIIWMLRCGLAVLIRLGYVNRFLRGPHFVSVGGIRVEVSDPVRFKLKEVLDPCDQKNPWRALGPKRNLKTERSSKKTMINETFKR